ARQVGKTYFIREYAKRHFKTLVEINFDLTPEKELYFEPSDVNDIIQLLETDLNQKIKPGETLLFLDEIQAAPQVLHKLRYFYENKPDLHIIAAGSLLDFLLKEAKFSMPVGRIEYLHLSPMTFEEFILAFDENNLYNFLQTYSLNKVFPPPLHQKLLKYFRLFLLIGGMPGAINKYIQSKDLEKVSKEHHSIIQSYIDDLNKYSGKYNPSILQTIFQKIPFLLAERIKYTNIISDMKTERLAVGINLLELAKITCRVFHTSANGIPLGAEKKEREFKLLFLDVGLASNILGIRLNELYLADDPMTINKGALCEQFIGQHLLYAHKPFMKPEIYFWNRQNKNSAAEVDYIHSLGQKIFPVEVKAGKTGTLKSLHIFLQEKNLTLAVRFNADLPTIGLFKENTNNQSSRKTELISLPLYMVGQLDRIILEQSHQSC
ncbi:MAG: ATP-binding protein, partial [Thiotrichaceae bacterium]|nr:ATP-binding protein [Thiotrichaceae bacterium]